MQLIFLPGWIAVILCFIVWPVLQIGASIICLKLPDRFYTPDLFFYRIHRFEKEGRLYERVFRVSRWKHLLPDGGLIWNKKAFSKKKLASFSVESLDRFLIESARAELTHWLAILPFWIFGFFTPMPVIWAMLIYALIVNMPCIIVQRYNRPRVQKLRRKISERDMIKI